MSCIVRVKHLQIVKCRDGTGKEKEQEAEGCDVGMGGGKDMLLSVLTV